MCQEAKILRNYALGRHKAYVVKNCLDQRRAQAIVKIMKVCDHFKNAKATGWINQIKTEILAILPSEESKFKDQRADIIHLLNTHTR